jgi:hypothetical protein
MNNKTVKTEIILFIRERGSLAGKKMSGQGWHLASVRHGFCTPS